MYRIGNTEKGSAIFRYQSIRSIQNTKSVQKSCRKSLTSKITLLKDSKIEKKNCQFDRFDYQIRTPKWAFSGKSINFWFNSETNGMCFSRFNMFWMLHFGLCICVKLKASENHLTKAIGRMKFELVKLKDEKRNKRTCNVAAFKLRLKNEMWCNVIETVFETADELNFLDFHFNCNLTLNSNEMKKKKTRKEPEKWKNWNQNKRKILNAVFTWCFSYSLYNILPQSKTWPKKLNSQLVIEFTCISSEIGIQTQTKHWILKFTGTIWIISLYLHSVLL